jgi:hypothetical protein
VEASGDVAPPRLQLEVRDETGLLVAADEVDTGPLGWNGGRQGLGARLDVPALPLSFGRFHLRLGLSAADDGRVLHQLDDPISFLVYPDDEQRGLVRLEGTWSAGANEEPR